MNFFISGGAKNGKSMFAQQIAKKMSEKDNRKLYYIATMDPVDDEDRARIKRHIEERRGWGFETVEQPRNLTDLLDRVDNEGVFLMDSVTALLSNEMFLKDGSFVEEAGEKVAADVVEFAKKTGHTVFVSDYIYSEAAIFDQWTEHYRKSLAKSDRELARVCDCVVEVAYGSRIFHKGGAKCKNL